MTSYQAQVEVVATCLKNIIGLGQVVMGDALSPHYGTCSCFTSRHHVIGNNLISARSFDGADGITLASTFQ